MKKMILASTSTLYKQSYLEYLKPILPSFFKNIETFTFIPYARPGGITEDAYTQKVKDVFNEFSINVKGLHEYQNPKTAMENAQAIFTGGGNTFLLVNQLYKYDLIPILREQLYRGIPYLGTSAGSDIAGITMQTTNDMPIIYPPSFKTLGAVPFNLNVHYIEPNPNSDHMGETRETRIREFQNLYQVPVVGLKEGSWIEVLDNKYTLKGDFEAFVFIPNQEIKKIKPGEDFNF